MDTIIQNIITWVESLNCDCKNSERLQRLLNSLLSGDIDVDIENKMFTNTTNIAEISNLVGAVEVYKFMSTPMNFLNRFGIADIKTCLCNEYKSNYKLSSCFIRQTQKTLLCSNCILSYIQSNDYGDDDNDLVTIIDYVSNRINNEGIREIFNLYKYLLNSNRPPLNGSWATLIIKDRMRTAQKYATLIRNAPSNEKTTRVENDCTLSLLSGYVLVSNRILPSRRGRDTCYCSDLLYVFTYIKSIDRENFGVKPTKICLLNEEFMLIEYELCSLNNVLSRIENDKLKHIILKDGKQGIHKFYDGGGDIESIIDSDVNDNKYNNDDDNESDYMNLGSILLSIYKNATMGSNYNNGDSGDNIQSYNTNNEIAANAAALLGDYRNANNSAATTNFIDNTNMNIMNSDTVGDIILPPPITQQTTLEELRKTTKAVSSISTKDMDQNILSLRVLKFDNIIYPYSCSLLPPPIIIRKSFNRYIFLSNINEYFDSIKFCTSIISVPVKESTLYEQIIMTINTIRELSLIMCCDKYDDDGCKEEEEKSIGNDNNDDDNDIDDDDTDIYTDVVNDNNNHDDDNDDDEDDDSSKDENDYEKDDENDGINNTKIINKKKIKKISPIFSTHNINTQLGVPVTHDEEIQRYINITSLNHLLQKQENNLFLQK